MSTATKLIELGKGARVLVPERILSRRRHNRAKDGLSSLLKAHRTDVVSVEPGPIPPPDVMLTTAIMAEADSELKNRSATFYTEGYRSTARILEAIKRNGGDLSAIKDVYELGCGGARLIRVFRTMSDVSCVGSDVNAAGIEWCKANVPGVEFHVNELSPPLNFAKDDSFDLVLAQSVFTHIPLDVQGAWIDEMYRVVRPGGFCYFTVLGKVHQRRMLTPEEQERLDRDGNLTLTGSDESASYSTKHIDSWDVFQNREQLHAAFGRKFKIAEHVESRGRLDILILQKPV